MRMELGRLEYVGFRSHKHGEDERQRVREGANGRRKEGEREMKEEGERGWHRKRERERGGG